MVDREAVNEAAELQSRKRLRIGEVPVEAGLLTRADIERALAEQQKRKGKRIGEVMVELGLLRETDLARTLDAKFDIPFVDLNDVAINPDAARLAGKDLIARYGVMPLDVDARTLTVAIADSTSIDAIESLRVVAQRRVREVAAVGIFVDDVVVSPTRVTCAPWRPARSGRGSVDASMTSALAVVRRGVGVV